MRHSLTAATRIADIFRSSQSGRTKSGCILCGEPSNWRPYLDGKFTMEPRFDRIVHKPFPGNCEGKAGKTNLFSHRPMENSYLPPRRCSSREPLDPWGAR
jgi:hypothetical protein